MTILRTQVPTRTTEWPESDETPCEASVEWDSVTWYCTRKVGHEDAVHAAHYDAYVDGDGDHDDDARFQSMVGVAWTEED